MGYLPRYVKSALMGGLILDVPAEVHSTPGNSFVVVEGKNGLGQVVGPRAMEAGMERAQETGVAIVGTRNSHHLGRIGAFAEQCAAEGFVSMHFVNVVGW